MPKIYISSFGFQIRPDLRVNPASETEREKHNRDVYHSVNTYHSITYCSGETSTAKLLLFTSVYQIAKGPAFVPQTSTLFKVLRRGEKSVILFVIANVRGGTGLK